MYETMFAVRAATHRVDSTTCARPTARAHGMSYTKIISARRITVTITMRMIIIMARRIRTLLINKNNENENNKDMNKTKKRNNEDSDNKNNRIIVKK